MAFKKKIGKWRVCVDFTDLNKACPKDPFPMPRIDQLVDVTVGHPQMNFLDVFQGYHQIPLTVEDQEKTAFVTPVGIYHYKVLADLVAKFAKCPEEVESGSEKLGERLVGVASVQGLPP